MASPERKLKKNSVVLHDLLKELRHHLVMREVSSGVELLEQHEDLFTALAARSVSPKRDLGKSPAEGFRSGGTTEISPAL